MQLDASASGFLRQLFQPLRLIHLQPSLPLRHRKYVCYTIPAFFEACMSFSGRHSHFILPRQVHHLFRLIVLPTFDTLLVQCLSYPLSHSSLALHIRLAEAASNQLHDLFVTAMALCRCCCWISLAARLMVEAGSEIAFGPGNDCITDATGSLLEHTMMWFQGILQSLAHVPQEVPAIGDLNRLRQAPAGRLRIGAGTIPADDLRTRMLPQPCGHGLGFPGRGVNR